MERRHQFYQQYPEHSHIFFEAMIATPEELEADIAPQKAIFLDLNEQVCQKLISESKLKEHIDEKRAMDYLRLIQDMFRQIAVCLTWFQDMNINYHRFWI
ncbi:hypothetical protein [Streptococcus mitis]|uniref:hypothetical protein n=1 Tax=Streptococcus mitis TaxID=28037 RepID=UPI002001D19B|nr:hypothetical protein [Streptococcus mitis]